MKRVFFFILSFILIYNMVLATTQKVAVLNFEKNDKKSDYVAKALMSRDIKNLFKGEKDLELIDLKKTKKIIKSSGYTCLFSLDKKQIFELGKKLNADIVVWGNVSSISDIDYKITAKILSIKSNDVILVNFNVTKSTSQRIKAFKENLIKKIIEFSGGEVDKCLGIAMQYFKNKNYSAAEQSFLRVLEIDNTKLEAYFYLGYINFVKDNPDYKKSEEYYLKGLELDPNDKNLLDYLSVTYLKQNKYEDAIRSLKKMAVIENSKEIWLRIGNIYSDMEYYDEAQEALEKAIGLDPNYLEAQKLLGIVLFKQDSFEEAIPYLETANKAFPDDDDIQKKLAKAYHKAGKLDSAIKQYSTLIAEQPNNLNAYINLASAYRITDKNQEALETLLKLKEIAPDNPKVYFRLADIYISLKKLKEAEKNANKAIELDPKIYEPYKILAQIYQNLGYSKYEEYLNLDEKAKKAYGDEADRLVQKRDTVKGVANDYFVKSGNYLNEAKKRTNNTSVLKDIDSRRKILKQLLDATKKGWF